MSVDPIIGKCERQYMDRISPVPSIYLLSCSKKSFDEAVRVLTLLLHHLMSLIQLEEAGGAFKFSSIVAFDSRFKNSPPPDDEEFVILADGSVTSADSNSAVVPVTVSSSHSVPLLIDAK
jgi:hypothetical protein